MDYSIALVLANLLTLLATFVHAIIGDKELRMIEPVAGADKGFKIQEIWTMARSGWHWISFDLLLATVVLSLINFTEVFSEETLLLHILTLCFFGYGLVWLIGIIISRPFPGNYFKLGQWILLWVISALIYWGSY